MDLVVFENNKPWVIDEFREGRFDYVELASDVAETKFFQSLFGQQVVDRLVQHYPSPRDRHHVPLWMYVCSQLTLRLHGQHSFHSYPLIAEIRGQKLDDNGTFVRGIKDTRIPGAIRPAMGSAGSPDPARLHGELGCALVYRTEPEVGRFGLPRLRWSPPAAGTLASA